MPIDLLDRCDAADFAVDVPWHVSIYPPLLKKRSRVWADKLNRECCSPYYGVLVRKDEQERKENFDNLIKGLEVSYNHFQTVFIPLGVPTDNCLVTIGRWERCCNFSVLVTVYPWIEMKLTRCGGSNADTFFLQK